MVVVGIVVLSLISVSLQLCSAYSWNAAAFPFMLLMLQITLRCEPHAKYPPEGGLGVSVAPIQDKSRVQSGVFVSDVKIYNNEDV